MYMPHECQDQTIDAALAFDAIQAHPLTTTGAPQAYSAVAFAAHHLLDPVPSASPSRISVGIVTNILARPSQFDKSRNLSNVVLVVDDDRNALEEMVEALRDFGLTVLTAENGPDAVEIAQLRRPRCVIMDFDLPGFNGLETVTRMRRFIPLSTFIMISGHDNFCCAATTKNTKTIAILQKPVCMAGVARFIKASFDETKGKLPKFSTMVSS